jgi:hypothetical protein
MRRRLANDERHMKITTVPISQERIPDKALYRIGCFVIEDDMWRTALEDEQGRALIFEGPAVRHREIDILLLDPDTRRAVLPKHLFEDWKKGTETLPRWSKTRWATYVSKTDGDPLVLDCQTGEPAVMDSKEVKKLIRLLRRA